MNKLDHFILVKMNFFYEILNDMYFLVNLQLTLGYPDILYMLENRCRQKIISYIVN